MKVGIPGLRGVKVTRKPGESVEIRVGSDTIVVTITRTTPTFTKLAIEGPPHVLIHRAELFAKEILTLPEHMPSAAEATEEDEEQCPFPLGQSAPKTAGVS